MKWCVEGAVAYYRHSVAMVAPKTVLDMTDRESRDKLVEFEEFIHEYIEKAPLGFLSSAEIKEVFLIKAGFPPEDITGTTSKELYQLLKRILAPPTDTRNSYGVDEKYRGVVSIVRDFPTRDFTGRPQRCQASGYLGVRWKSGDIAVIVNALRREYVKHNLPDIPSEPIKAAPAAESADTAAATPPFRRPEPVPTTETQITSFFS